MQTALDLLRSRNPAFRSLEVVDSHTCGTATCARKATPVAKGELEIGETFVSDGLLGTIHRGVPLRGTEREGHQAIVAEVEDSARISACGPLLVDPTHPLGAGYLA